MSKTAKAYDYVIVGAGSAGCVLSARLSADGARVLVLEAGDHDRHWLLHVPIGVGKVWHDARFNWSYMSEPEPNLGDRQIFHPRGKVVGGSSSINMMAYVRGHRGDYDRWRQMGLDGWAYDDVLPYFKRAQSFAEASTEFHGTDGPWNIQTTDIDDPIIETFFEAARSAGYELAEDYNGAVQDGFAKLQVNVHQGRRRSAAVAYLHPSLSRPNLDLEVAAHVTRVVFDGTRAVGVDYVQGGTTHRVLVEREVILSGGVIKGKKGYFIKPVIVRDVKDGDDIVDKEQFGPVLPLIKFSNVRKAGELANASDYGLGVEQSDEGLEEYTQIQVLNVAR